MVDTGSITVLELNRRLSDAIAAAPDVRNVWVIGETSDLRVSGGHCYLELIEKNAEGSTISKIRATIWASNFRRINGSFRSATQADLASGIKIRACVTASYHPSYGMAINITEIDPAYTLGDAMRLRAEILQRLSTEGILELNKQLQVALAPNRVAVISAQGAAGFGDFITHLCNNTARLRFSVDLYDAVMQGERTVPTVLNALSAISQKVGQYDVVVIIRGGGATTDLAAFDNYELAAAIARFPLPVIIGIGHERDTSVLDHVAMLRVKTPTAAAEWLIDRVSRLMNALGRCADKIYQLASQQIAANREMLAQAEATVPGCLIRGIITRQAVLDRLSSYVVTAVDRNLEKATQKISQIEALMKALSPDAVIARGFSVTMLNDGTIVRDANKIPQGTEIITRLTQGTLHSVTK
ncbi:MAG: exodeoxyribonuclease VII large subunit [Muribaculaceae bacterium]|nr:exodeoxyribonuclease VII large subunit [Muribaculaceae bacterium]